MRSLVRFGLLIAYSGACLVVAKAHSIPTREHNEHDRPVSNAWSAGGDPGDSELIAKLQNCSRIEGYYRNGPTPPPTSAPNSAPNPAPSPAPSPAPGPTDHRPPPTLETPPMLIPMDFALLAKIHVTSIEFCVAPSLLMPKGKPERDLFRSLDQDLAHIADHKMATILDAADDRIDLTSANGKAGWIAFWQQMAKRYRGKYRFGLAFQLLDAPYFQDPASWAALETEAIDEIRKIDPDRWILLSGSNRGSAASVIAQTPLTRDKLMYAAKFDDPENFTHQGDPSVGEPARSLVKVPFPATEESISYVVGDQVGPDVDVIRAMGRARLDSDYIAKRLGMIAEWSNRTGVPVITVVSGVTQSANSESRAKWFEAVRKALKNLNMASSLPYDGDYGLGRVQVGETLRLDVLTALWFYGLDLPGPIFFEKPGSR